jgi:PAS domain S-box-containing protein
LAIPIDRLIELDEQESRRQLERGTFQTLAEALIEALPDALIVIDATGKIVLFNEKAEFMFGYHRSEMIGQTVEKLMPERARPRHAHDRQIYNRFDISQRTQTMGIGANLLGVRKDGHEFPVDITLARMVVPKGVFNLALMRFSRRILEREAAFEWVQQPPAEMPPNPEEADAGR